MTPSPADVRAAWLVSIVAVVWTLASGGAAIALGVTAGSAVLVAFGAIGFVDALGSAALVYHFRHALRHDALAEHLERAAHLVVTAGLVSVGLGAVAISVVRLVGHHAGEAPAAGIVLAALSLGVLVILSTWKIVVARRLPSAALRADGLLSRVGAAQAAVTLAGTAAQRWLDWTWVDAGAAIVVGTVAVIVGVLTAPDGPSVGPEGIEPSA